MYTIYGIKNCTTVQKALAYLESQGLAYTFVDYKHQPPSLADLDRWRQGFGGLPVNKASLTFRKIKDAYEAADESGKEALLRQHTSAIKRPILEGGGLLLKGFNPKKWPAGK